MTSTQALQELEACIRQDNVQAIQQWEVDHSIIIDGTILFADQEGMPPGTTTARILARECKAFRVDNWLRSARHLASKQWTLTMMQDVDKDKFHAEAERAKKMYPNPAKTMFHGNRNMLDMVACYAKKDIPYLCDVIVTEVNLHPRQLRYAIEANSTAMFAWFIQFWSKHKPAFRLDVENIRELLIMCMQKGLFGCFWGLRFLRGGSIKSLGDIAQSTGNSRILEHIFPTEFPTERDEERRRYKLRKQACQEYVSRALEETEVSMLWNGVPDSFQILDSKEGYCQVLTHAKIGFKILNTVLDNGIARVIAMTLIPKGATVLQSRGGKIRCNEYVLLQAKIWDRDEAYGFTVKSMLPLWSPVRLDDCFLYEIYKCPNFNSDTKVQCGAGYHLYTSLTEALLH